MITLKKQLEDIVKETSFFKNDVELNEESDLYTIDIALDKIVEDVSQKMVRKLTKRKNISGEQNAK